MDAIASREHKDAARRLRAMVAAYEAKRDLVTLGAYTKGTDAELDEALAHLPAIEGFLAQDAGEVASFGETVARLGRVVA
jgi:flagellar biosynthesis/type III secretory pathway ATPase